MKSYSGGSAPLSEPPVPASHHQSTPRHSQLEQSGPGISRGGNQSQATAKQSTSSNSYNAGTPRRPESLTSRYDHSGPPPLQPHNSNVPGLQRGSHSSPSPRNPERSRSPRRQPKTTSVIGRQDYCRNSSPVSPPRWHH